MKEAGLWPSRTGEPGGKETGVRVTHYIIEGGCFDEAYAKLRAGGLELRWESRVLPSAASGRESKTKYTCPVCGLNAWAKPDARLVCEACSAVMGSAV
jgi:hypothetical protein